MRRISRYRCRRVNEIKAALAQPSRSRVVLERNELDALFPEYGFRENMGYGTRQHLAALERYGPSPIHRRSFAPVREPRLPGL